MTDSDETKNARREELRPKDLHFYCDDLKCGAKKFWRAGYDACEREMSAEIAKQEEQYRKLEFEHELTVVKRDKLEAEKKELVEMMPRMADSVPWASKLNREKAEEQLTQWREMCEKMAEALSHCEGSICLDNNQEYPLADYNAFLEKMK